MARPILRGQSLVDKVFDKLSEKIETPAESSTKITKKIDDDSDSDRLSPEKREKFQKLMGVQMKKRIFNKKI